MTGEQYSPATLAPIASTEATSYCRSVPVISARTADQIYPKDIPCAHSASTAPGTYGSTTFLSPRSAPAL